MPLFYTFKRQHVCVVCSQTYEDLSGMSKRCATCSEARRLEYIKSKRVREIKLKWMRNKRALRNSVPNLSA